MKAIAVVFGTGIAQFSGPIPFQFGSTIVEKNINDPSDGLATQGRVATQLETATQAFVDFNSMDFNADGQQGDDYYVGEELDYDDDPSYDYPLNETEQMSDLLGGQGTRHFHRLKSMILHMHPRGGLRSSGRLWKDVKRYGCWCWVNGRTDGKTLTQGTGRPVDEVDAACKRLYQCYQCAERDYAHEYCDYVTSKYDAKLKSDVEEGKHIVCRDGGKSCKTALCECDRQFALDYNRLYDGHFNPNHHQVHGLFDPFDEQSCPSSPSTQEKGERVCCGDYPNRFPMVNNAYRKCCGEAGKSYNPVLYDCCSESGRIAARGNC